MKFSFLSSAKISEEYLEQIRHIDQKEFPQPWSDDDWLQIRKANQYYLSFHVNDLNSIDAFALFTFTNLDPVAHLLKIIVTEKARKTGIGKQLLGASLRQLHSLGATRCFLEVESRNVAAQALYNSLGFKTIHQKRAFYSNGDDALMMESNL